MTYIKLNTASILKAKKDGNIFYYAILIESLPTRDSKIDISHFKKYKSLNDAINKIKENIAKSNFLYKWTYSPIDNILFFIQYDAQKIKILKFDNQEIIKIQSLEQ